MINNPYRFGDANTPITTKERPKIILSKKTIIFGILFILGIGGLLNHITTLPIQGYLLRFENRNNNVIIVEESKFN